MTRIIVVSGAPVDLFAVLGPGGFGTARTPGRAYRVQNVGQETIRYASAAVMPTDLSMGFRLGAGGETDLIVQYVPTWAWVSTASGAGRLAMEF